MDTDLGLSPRKWEECRICHDEDDILNMENPCSCSGTLKYAHRRCVQRWCNEKGDTICEICLQSTILLLMRLTLPIVLSVADIHSATQSMLVLINIAGVILLILMMVKVFTAMQHLAFQQGMRRMSYHGSIFNHI